MLKRLYRRADIPGKPRNAIGMLRDIGGAMANTFLHAQGVSVGKSLCEHDMAEAARKIMGSAEAAGCEIVPRQSHHTSYSWCPRGALGAVNQAK